MNILTKTLAAVGLGLLAQLPANAAIVSTWGYDVETLWTSATPAGVPPNGVAISGDQKTLSWGDANTANRSSLAISTDPIGTVNTFVGLGLPGPGFIAAGSALTHHNNPVAGTTLESAMLQSTLNLFASGTDGSGAGTGPGSIVLNILFNETPNSAPCTVSSPTPCNDIFVLTTPLQNQSFDWDGTTYFVNLFPTNGALAFLTDAACASVGITTGTSGQRCVGFTTPENQDTTLAFGFTISTRPLSIPEPNVLALAGLAFLAAAWARKQRKS